MSTSAYRRRRGNETQNAVADWFKEHGWPHAESAGSGRRGTDVLGLPGLLVEVKARRELRLLEWLKQHSLPAMLGRPDSWAHVFVVHRPDGMGPAQIQGWPVTMRLDDFTALLREAGYGGTGESA